MRQTLWAECICRNKVEKVLPAEHFVHIHVCPKDNRELLNKCYSEVTDKSSMEEAWREVLTDQSLYHLVDPKGTAATNSPVISRTLQLLTRQILAMRILHTFCGVFRVFSFVYVPDDK